MCHHYRISEREAIGETEEEPEEVPDVDEEPERVERELEPSVPTADD